MKNVIISILLSGVMIIAISLSIKYLNKVSKNLGSINDDIELQISDEDWDKAYKSSIELKDKWKNYSKKIKLFSDHQEIDNIEMELWKLPQYIKENSKDEALATIHVLRFLLEHIAELEEIKIQNIF